MTMSMTRRAAIGRLLAGAALPALAACEGMRLAEAPSRKPSEGGIGGTGIVGIVTDLGSLIINGLRVETTEATEVIGPGGPLPIEAVIPGMSLTVEAGGPPDALLARRVVVNPPLIGRIVLDAQGAMTVNGVSVRIEPGAPSLVSAGETVAVAGLWDGTTVVASRLDRTDPGRFARIAGVAGRDVAGRPTVGGRPITLPVGVAPPPVGRFVTVTGRDGPDVFVAEAVEIGRFSPGFRDLVRLSVEGYLEQQAEAPGFAISGLGHSLDEAAMMTPLAGKRALIEGPYDGRFAADRGLLLPGDVGERRVFLSQRLDGSLSPNIALR